MFKSLKRITYPVTDLAKAGQWYRQVLGINPALETSYFMIFIVGECSLTLAQAKPETDAESQLIVYWEVDDVTVAWQKLLDLGASPVAEIRTMGDVRFATVKDPFNNIIGITDKPADAAKQSVENQPSQSAMTVVFCRALAACDPRPETKGPDYLAEIFVAEDSKKHLQDNTAREWLINKLITPALYGYFIARTAFYDQVFLDAVKENIPQIVFLGAGYDSRSIRFAEHIKETKIFELDVPLTQERKKKLLQQAAIKTPQQLNFVPINFKTEKITDVLLKAGFVKNHKTLFIWEGVSYYLAPELAAATLEAIKSLAPAGSGLCVDFMTEQRQSVYAGEPFLFWLAAEQIKPFLAQHGFTVIEQLNADSMVKRFLTLQDGTPFGQSLQYFDLVYAEIAG
ncbi:MAG TPA: SAM-dependent methyltransferase [bacterium]|nr:SAM-dependent methyltransferase [bacterium]HPN45043.1 SAM-dependent methyltransferase [bacterium]